MISPPERPCKRPGGLVKSGPAGGNRVSEAFSLLLSLRPRRARRPLRPAVLAIAIATIATVAAAGCASERPALPPRPSLHLEGPSADEAAHPTIAVRKIVHLETGKLFGYLKVKEDLSKPKHQAVRVCWV